MRDEGIEEKPLELTKSFIVIADILGYSELLRKCSNDKNKTNIELKRLNDTLNEGCDLLTPQDGKGIIKIYTDNLLFRYSNESKLAYKTVLELISYYQLTLALGGYFIRGAFVVGDTYVDEKIAFGYPIVEAHDLESKNAINPRIIISENVCKLVSSFPDMWHPKGIEYEHFLLRDNDGYYFVNYLAILYYNCDDTNLPLVLDYLRSHKMNIEKELKSVHPYGVISKYEWVANYHDFFCQTYYPEDETLLIKYENKSEFELFRI